MRSLLLIRNNSKLFRIYLLNALIPLTYCGPQCVYPLMSECFQFVLFSFFLFLVFHCVCVCTWIYIFIFPNFFFLVSFALSLHGNCCRTFIYIYIWSDLVHLFVHFILNGLKTMSNYSEVIFKYLWWLTELLPGQHSNSHLTQLPCIIY